MSLATESTSSPRTRVIRWVSESIRSGGLMPGEPLPSERVLAERLKVSRDTVRAALRSMSESGMIGREGERLRKVLPQPGQVMQATQRQVLSSTVTILGKVPAYEPPGSWDGSIHYAAARLLERAGLHVLSINSQSPEPVDGEQIAAMSPRGVLVTYAAAESTTGQAVIRACQQAAIPVVTYGDGPSLQQVDRVDSDHAGGAYELTRHLISRGCRRILRLWRFPEEHHWLNQRSEGYERALTEAGLPVLPLLRTPRLIDKDVLEEPEFRHVVRMLAGYLSEHVLGPEPIDGLMLATDCHAIQAAAALRLLGKKPNEDVLLLGYDNSLNDCTDRQYESATPVATMDKNNPAIAQALVDLLQKRMTGTLSAEPQTVTVPPRMVVAAD